MLAKDGQDRGLQWGPLNGKGSINLLDPPTEKSGDSSHDAHPGDEDAELKPKKHKFSRWVIAFEDEMEARRFVRTWHRRPYPFPVAHENSTYGEPPALVHAEFLW